MRNNVVQEQELSADQTLKVTALLYLQEALLEQDYESCKELIDAAVNLGASSSDISAVIAESLKSKSSRGQKESRLNSL